MHEIIVNQPVKSVTAGKARLSSRIQLPTGDKELWYEVDATYSDKFAHETCDGFVVAILPLAAKLGLNVRVHGTMSSKLFYNINSYLSELLHTLIPGAARIGLSAEQLTTDTWGASDVFTGFSAGVDSFCTLVDHIGTEVPPEYRITQLLFNNVGSHGQSSRDYAIFRERFDRLKEHAQLMNLPLMDVNSNIDDVIGMPFQLTHTLRNVSVVLVLQKACAKYLYSSTVHYRNSYVRATYDIGHADAVCLPLLSTETTDCISSGGQYSRFEKTLRLAAFEPSYKALDVCVQPSEHSEVNCSRCWKCLRTLLTLEVIGKLNDFKDVFDLKVYEVIRPLYIGMVLSSKDPLLLEIRKGIAEHHYPVPLLSKIYKLIPNKISMLMIYEAGRTGQGNPVALSMNIACRIFRRLCRKA